jgi:hypothetical protein
MPVALAAAARPQVPTEALDHLSERLEDDPKFIEITGKHSV